MRCELIFSKTACNPCSGRKEVAICAGQVAFWASDGMDLSLEVWSISEMSCACICLDCKDVVCFSPDGERLVAGGDLDIPASVWDVKEGKRLWSLGNGTDGIFSDVLFSPDGALIVIASREPNYEDIGLFCGKTGSELRTLCGGAFSLVFSADGEELAGVDETCRQISIVSTSSGDVLVWLSIADCAGSQCRNGVLLSHAEDFCFVGVRAEGGLAACLVRRQTEIRIALPDDLLGVC